MFAANAAPESEKLLLLARAAIDADAALLLVSIRSDSYGTMQGAKALAGIDQVPLSLGPVPQGEIARVIREPAEILRRKAGPAAPVFDAAVIERLQQEIEGEEDALPLLAFVLQRLMREHQGVPAIGLTELDRTGGVAAAIEAAAEAALADAGIGRDRTTQRDALRRLFIPRLARIDRESKAPQRRVARQSELPADLLALARALTQRRLLVVKLAGDAEGAPAPDAVTLEVAHEALLRRWPTLADLLAEDRDALLLLDGVLSAAADWDKAEAVRKPDFLAHRGSRLADAQALATRGADWERTIAPARSYLAACHAREAAEREEKEAALARERQRLAEIAAAQKRTARLQRRARWTLAALSMLVVFGLGVGFWLIRTNLATKAQLEQTQANTVAELSNVERLSGRWLGALRLALRAARLDLLQGRNAVATGILAAAVGHSDWRLNLSGHENEVTSAAFSPDGARIVTASADETARIWDAATGKEITVLRGHENRVTSAAFSPDGARIVTASWDKTARIWDAATGKEITVLRGHDDFVTSAAFSPDGARIVTASWDRTARIWDAATGKEITILRGHEASVTSAAFSPDGARIVTASGDKTARIWDAATGKEITVLRGHEVRVSSAAFSPDGARIVTASLSETARIWDAATGKEIAILRGHDDLVTSAAFSPDGARIVTASGDKTARIWDAATGKEITVLRGHENSVTSAAFSPDGARIVTASWDKTARIWDAATGKEIMVLRGHENEVSSAAFSPDGARIVTASWDKTARIWDAATGKEITVLRGHENDVTSAAFSPDGARIVTASWDKTARIWDAATGKEITVLRGHE